MIAYIGDGISRFGIVIIIVYNTSGIEKPDSILWYLAGCLFYLTIGPVLKSYITEREKK